MSVDCNALSSNEVSNYCTAPAGRILIVEDDCDTADSLVLALACNGHGVRAVNSREAALCVLEKLPQDLVIMDLRMPGMSAREFVCELRQLQPECAVLLMTADTRAELVAAELGIQHWIAKPFDLDGILNRIASATDHAPAIA